MILGGEWVDGNRSPDQLDRHRHPTGLTRQRTQQMKRVGMLGTVCQDLVIDRFGLGRTTRPVMFQGDLHRLFDRDLCHDAWIGGFARGVAAPTDRRPERT